MYSLQRPCLWSGQAFLGGSGSRSSRKALLLVLLSEVLAMAFFPTCQAIAAGTARQSPLARRFGETFLYGVVTMIPGGGTLHFPDGRAPIVRPTVAVLAPVNSLISTGASETAGLRLECGSLLEVAPGSRVAIRAWHLELQQGSSRVRHVGTVFPLKIGGVATLTMGQDSFLELTREGNSLTIAVQAGRIHVTGFAEPVLAGEAVIAAGPKVERSAFAPALPSGIPLDLWQAQDELEAPDLSDTLEDRSGSPDLAEGPLPVVPPPATGTSGSTLSGDPVSETPPGDPQPDGDPADPPTSDSPGVLSISDED